MAEKISETKENFKEASSILQNIIEGHQIERFKFTPKELNALLFLADLVSANLKELEGL